MRAGPRSSLAAAGRHPLDEPSPDGAASLASALANLRSCLGLDGVERSLADARFVEQSERPTRSRWLIGACRALAIAHLANDAMTDAMDAVDEGCDLCAGNPTFGSISLLFQGLRGLLLLERGAADEAERCTSAARRFAIDEELTGTIESLPSVAAAAIVAHRRGDDEAASRIALSADPLLVLAQTTPVFLAVIGTRLVDLELDLGHRERAVNLLDQIERNLRRIPDLGALPARLERLHGRLDTHHPGYELLTPAERRVLAQLATHRTLAEIGKVLYVSRTTVKSHVASIYSKLGASTRDEAVSFLPASEELES